MFPPSRRRAFPCWTSIIGSTSTTPTTPSAAPAVNRGEDAHTDKQFKLDKESAMALSKLFLTPEKDLEDKKISDVLPDSFWSTNFWLYWQTMFAFQRWSSALEMKRYLCRYVHHIDGLPDFSALRFTKYNQYESMILPLVKYLESHGVQIEYGMDVKNVIIETVGDKKVAKQIVYVKDGQEQTIDLIEDDLVFITNGCCTDTSCYGDQTHAPDLSEREERLRANPGICGRPSPPRQSTASSAIRTTSAPTWTPPTG